MQPNKKIVLLVPELAAVAARGASESLAVTGKPQSTQSQSSQRSAGLAALAFLSSASHCQWPLALHGTRTRMYCQWCQQ